MTILDNLLLPCYHKSLDDKNAFLVAENRHNVFGYVDGTLYQWTKSTGRNLLNNQVDLTIKTPVDIFNEKMNAVKNLLTALQEDILKVLTNPRNDLPPRKILAIRYVRIELEMSLIDGKQFVEWLIENPTA